MGETCRMAACRWGAAAAVWEASLRACLAGAGSVSMLATLCADLQGSVRLWLGLRLAHSPVSPTVLTRALRAVQVTSAPPLHQQSCSHGCITPRMQQLSVLHEPAHTLLAAARIHLTKMRLS